MKLTPLDIHHKEFRRAIRGYNEEEVDVFLDQVAAEFERVFKENIEQKEQYEKMSEKLKQYEGIEQTLQKALLTAQQAADEVQNNAQKESDLIVKDAELKAKEIIQQILSEKQELQRNLEKLQTAEKNFKDNFREMLNQYITGIEKVEKGEEPDSGEGASFSVDEQAVSEKPPVVSDKASFESDAHEEKTEFDQKPDNDVEKEIDAKRTEIEAKQAEMEAKKAEEEAKSAEIETQLREQEDKEARIEAEVEEAEHGKHESAPEASVSTQNDVKQTDDGRLTSGYKIPEQDVPAEHPDLTGSPKGGTDWVKPAGERSGAKQEQPQKPVEPSTDVKEGFKVTLGHPETGSKEKEPSVDTRPEQPMDSGAESPTPVSETIPEFRPEEAGEKPSEPSEVAQSVSSFFDDDLGVDEEEKKSDHDENISDNNSTP